MRRLFFTLLWGFALILYVSAGWWIFVHPPVIGSDDALFFTRALIRFSILDFSPQFPGYPGFVAFGRLALLVTGGPVAALGLTTAVIALMLPVAAGCVAWRVANPLAAWLAVMLTLVDPLLPDLALNLLSDGSALLFFLFFLALLAGERGGWGQGLLAGLALGTAAVCRPSDAALFVGAVIGLLTARPRLVPPVLIGSLTVGMVALGFLFAREGWLYVEEGRRFLVGHTTDWGNTAFARAPAQLGWWGHIWAVPSLALLLGIFGLGGVLAGRRFQQWPVVTTAAGACVGHGLFILFLQNPDHLRHLAPLTVIGGLLVALTWTPGRSHHLVLPLLALAASVACLVLTVDPWPGRPPPLAAVAAVLRVAPPGSAVAAREGVFALRALVPGQAVYDRHYPADAVLGLKLARGRAFVLTTTPPVKGTEARVFPSRFLGEESVWLTEVWR